MITARLNVCMFPGGYDYRSVEVNGTEYTDVAVPLIYMAAGLQGTDDCIHCVYVCGSAHGCACAVKGSVAMVTLLLVFTYDG